MLEKHAYLKVAERNLESSGNLADASIQESSGFCSYHAFESLGGALCSHFAVNYPKGHGRKINEFRSTAGRVDRAFQHGVSATSIILDSIGRNSFLYPKEQPDGSFSIPEQLLSKSDAKDLLRRVKGIHRKVKSVTR